MNELVGIAAILLGCLLIPGCASKCARNDFLAAIDSGKAPLVLDVRSQGEYLKGHVPGAVNINVMALPFRMHEIKVAKDDPLVVYCAHGPRAGLAGFFLRLGGFRQVYHLEGDMNSWHKAGLPVEIPLNDKGEIKAGLGPPLSNPDGNE